MEFNSSNQREDSESLLLMHYSGLKRGHLRPAISPFAINVPLRVLFHAVITAECRHTTHNPRHRINQVLQERTHSHTLSERPRWCEPGAYSLRGATCQVLSDYSPGAGDAGQVITMRSGLEERGWRWTDTVFLGSDSPGNILMCSCYSDII